MENIDWDLVRQMRQGFLDASGHLPDYWRDQRWLACYDQTLAQRIRWKWLAVLSSMAERLDCLRNIPVVVDWGCGTGIAVRSLLEVTGLSFAQLKLYDRSALATRFAAMQIAREYPGQSLEILPSRWREEQPYLLLVSHVLSELPPDELAALTAAASKAAAVLWVEPGRPQESRLLSTQRENLRSTHHILGPCLHQAPCGVLSVGHETDWCHFFAPIPQEVYHSAFWREFSRRMKIDLRSLPVSWLATVKPEFSHGKGVRADDEQALILGRPLVHKAYCRWLACTKSGLCNGDFPKRSSKDIYQRLANPDYPAVFSIAQLQQQKEVED